MFPVVSGALWSNADRPPPDDGAPGDNNWQKIVSRLGAILCFDDTAGSEKVELIDSSGQLSVTLESSGDQIVVRPGGRDVENVADDNLPMPCPDIELTAQNDQPKHGDPCVTDIPQHL